MIADVPVWLHGFTHEIQNEGGDLPQQVWFLGSTPYALLHGQNPFLTYYLNYPYGANLMVNTTMFLPGLILAPVTFTLGAVASFNVLMVAAIAGSATAAFAVFQRWVKWKPAAFVGGLLYGFSPYMVGAAYGHLNVLLIVFPPVALLVLDNILIRQPGRPVRWGLALGLLASAQFFTSTDVLASSAVIIVAGIAVLALARPRLVAAKLPYAAKALVAALVAFVALCAYPTWVLLLGPQHITGPLHPANSLDVFSTDLLGLIYPTSNELIAPSQLQHVANAFVGGDFSENASYIGIPLLLLLAAVVMRYWREAIVRFASALLIIALILSFGTRLRIDGHVTKVRLPFDVLKHLPLLDNLLAVRFSIYIFLCAGLLAAVGLDRLHRERSSPTRPLGPADALGAVLVLFALVPLVPRWPYPVTSTTSPAFFRTSTVNSIPPGSVLLTYPFATPFHDQAMTWQAEDGFRFRMPGGYMLSPGPGGLVSLGPPSETQGLLEEAFGGQALQPLSKTVLCDVDNDLRIWQVRTIVVTNAGIAPGEALDLFNAELRVSPRHVAGTYVYYDVPPLVARTAALLDCQPTTQLP